MHLVGERVEAFLNAVFALTGYSGLQDGLLDEGGLRFSALQEVCLHISRDSVATFQSVARVIGG